MMRLLIFVMFISVAYANAREMTDPIKIMSYNIRLDHAGDSNNGDGWAHRRKAHVINLIRHYSPELFGVQEAKKNQMDDLLNALPEYDFIGVGRDDGKDAGEFSAIFYKKERFEVKESSTFWLSETPDKPSKAWDAALPRIVTWGKFKDNESGKEFYFYNTHFDHVGVTARAESAKLIVEKIQNRKDTLPVIVSGDFNAIPAAEPYKILSAAFKDAAEVSKNPAYGPKGTFSGFDLKEDQDFRQIDYIFVNGAEVISFETIADYVNDKFPSDHLPVMAEIEL